jgi:hypothetical protein
MKKRGVLFGFAALVMAAMVLAGCGGSNKPNPESDFSAESADGPARW